MSSRIGKPLNVIDLGQFMGELPPLTTRLNVLKVVQSHCDSLDQLPMQLAGHEVLVTELSWLNGLAPAMREALIQRVAMAAGWIALTEANTCFKDQIAWQRNGVSHFFQMPLDADRLAALIEDIHDQLNGPPVRVVLVDDDESSLSYYSSMLRQAGIDTLDIQNPLLTQEALGDFKPDLLLTDIKMPDCNGPELATILRQHPEYTRLPAIFLTTVESMQEMLYARATASADFLTKPVTPKLLITAVKSHARRYRSMQRAKAFRHQQEMQARSRLEQLSAAIDEHAIVSIADIRGSIVHVNDKFCAISGYSREALLGQNHRMIKSDIHPAEFYHELWRTISNGKTWHGEVCNRRQDGELYWVGATVVPFLDDRGWPTQYISIRTDITTLKQSQEALRVSEERLRRSQIFANIGTWDWNIQTGKLFWSERIAPLFGYPAETLETSYDNFLKAIHPDDRQAVIDAVDTCLEYGLPYEIEHRVLWPDGTARWLLERGAVVRDASGKATNMLGVVQDIHTRKHAELALAESENRLREAQGIARIGDWETDLESGELIWSKEVFNIFGRDPATFRPDTDAFHTAIHPDDRALVAARERQAATTGHYDMVHRIVRPDGSIRHVHKLGRSESDAAGKPIRLLGTVQDVTDRVEAETLLRESKERFTFAVEGAGDGIWDWNVLTGEMQLSGHYEAMLGFEKGELEPTIVGWVKNVHPDDLARVQQTMQDYMTGKLPVYAVELRLRRKDGSYTWILCRGTAVARDDQGNIVRMIGIHSDISERKAVEAALDEAREEAERANHAKSEFLSSMSHELRTPMNAILGFAQMLEYDSELNADQQDSVHEILKGGRHLLSLINEVLDLSKVESGHIDLSLEPVEIACVIEDCRAMIQPLAAARQITLQLEVPPHINVRADRVRFKQVLLNLLSNAIKYNREGGDVSLGLQPVADERLRITISDTGTGIAPNRIAGLFQPFNRLDAEYSEIEGTGIGLTITQRLVELMGGEVGVDSWVGVGTNFWLELPLESMPEFAHDHEAVVADSTAPIQSAEVEQHTVLCIDDNPVNLKLIAQMLGRRKHIHLLTAHTPELGIELALVRRPELILLDINMPGMNGFQVLEVFKANASLQNTPVIAVTANAMQRDIERGLAAGFTEYLTKPLDLGVFLSIVDRCLSISKENTA